VDGDVLAFDVFEDPLIGGGGAADVVIGLEAINGDDYGEVFEIRPIRGDGAEGAGDELDMDTALEEEGDHGFDFAVADERVAADEGEVEGLESIDDFEDAIDEGLALTVSKAAEGGAATEVAVVIGVTARAAERAFLGNFNGQRRLLAREDFSPGFHDLGSFQSLS
jgi:hypothetical protein